MKQAVNTWMRWLTILFLLLACSDGRSPQGTAPLGSSSEALSGPLVHDFEDGTLEGWIPRGGGVLLENTTEVAFDGARSLKTTGRSAGFHGPSLNLLGTLSESAIYRISVSARLLAGEASTTVRVTMQQTAPDGTNQFITVAQNSNVTDGEWVTLTGNFSYAANVTGLLLYVEATTATASYYIDGFSVTELTPPPAISILDDFEDGTLEGWIPRGAVTLTNTADQAADGARSLLTTGRTQGFHGPSKNLLGTLRAGATYQVSVKVRLSASEAPATVTMTMQRTPTGGSNQFDTVAQASNVTDAAWVTLSNVYSFAGPVSGLLLYVEASSATASYYIDTFTLTEIAPPPGPPANTDGASADFESGTLEGWFARTGTETLTVTNADANGGTQSLLTTNRTNTFRGPAFDVTNVLFNGSRYRIVLWAKLAPGEPPTDLRVSLERRLGMQPASFHTVIGNTTVTDSAWVRLAVNYDVALANTALTLYVESASGLASFYIDDFSIGFIPPPVAETDIPSVYETLAPFFPVGAAIHAGDLGGEHAVLLTKHFNSVTSENDMKWDALQPTEQNFTFATADAQVAFAKTNGMNVRGHTLVWHAQTPAWVFNDAAGNPMTPTPENRQLLLARLENHVRTVVAHFGEDVGSWDVVNEVIDPSQPDGFRRSPWFDVIGPEFIDRAFLVAREAAPNAKLYLNDFDTTNPTKRAFLLALVQDLESRSIPIDGMGHQMHNNVEFPSAQAIVETVNAFDALGVENEVTELDCSIYSGSFPDPIVDYAEVPADRLVIQGYRYRIFFEAFRELGSKLKSVTFWGQADDHTWLSSPSRVNAPLLFDQQLQKKHAYWGVVDPLQLPGADLAVSIDTSALVVAAGSEVTLTLAVENVVDEDTEDFQPSDDDLAAENPSLASAVPEGAVFRSLSVPAGWNCTTPAVGARGPIACRAASLDAGATATFELTVAVESCATPDGASLVAAASVASATRDPNPAPNGSATAAVTVSNSAPVIALAGSPSSTLECRDPFADPGATASDACDGALPVNVSGAVDSGTPGAYLVSYTATDSAAQSASVTRAVVVADSLAPALDLVDLTILLPGLEIVLNGQTLFINGQVYELTPRTIRLFGHTIVVDGSTITVDGEAFMIDGKTVLLLLPLGQYRTFTIDDLLASAADVCDASLSSGDAVITKVTSDEPEDAPGGSDGRTSHDIVIGSECRSVALRMERNRTGNGRVYTVTLEVRDASGNASTKDAKLVLPRGHGTGPSVDDGSAYTVTGSCE
jgi:endo-1,4-beta-xylanase